MCIRDRSFGDNAMSVTRIKKCYNRFKDGCTSVDNEPHSARPSTSCNDEIIDQVQTLVMEDLIFKLLHGGGGSERLERRWE